MDTVGSASEDKVHNHPTLFIREDMVTVQIQQTRFRIPLYFLTEDSEHFQQLFKEKDLSNVVNISEDGVSSSAFASFIKVLRPRLGVIGISSCSEWIEVLHLSSKWNFQDLRSAAIAALHPLASPVDKIVLCRTYDFSDWIEAAFAELLSREEDLTEEEVERLTSKDVAAIAKGRREARTTSVRSQPEIDAIARRLLSHREDSTSGTASPAPDVSLAPAPSINPSGNAPMRPSLFSNAGNQAGSQAPSVGQAPHPSHHSESTRPFPPSFGNARNQTSSGAGFAPSHDARREEAIIQINSFLDQLKDDVSKWAARRTLLEYLQADADRVDIALDMILKRGWVLFDRYAKRSGQTATGTCEDTAPPPYEADIDRWSRELTELHKRNPNLGLAATSPKSLEAMLRLVQNWEALLKFDLDSVPDLTQHDEWQTFVKKIKYVAHLCGRLKGHDYITVSTNVFHGLWYNMTALIWNAPRPQKGKAAQALKGLLHEVRALIQLGGVFAAQSKESDAFYLSVQDARDEAREKGDTHTATALDDLVQSRFRPAPAPFRFSGQ